MNKILKTAAGSSLRTGSYVSPEAKVTEMLSEGVLCGSEQDTTLSIEKWEDGTFQW